LTTGKFGQDLTMKQLIILGLGALIFTACDKDKFQTQPQLKIESLNYDFVPKNESLRVTLSFTDKEGDVDDTLYVVRTRLNQRGPYSDQTPFDYKIPSFPDQQNGEIELNMSYGLDLTVNLPSIFVPGTTDREPDTMALKFVLLDKGKNASDTAIANVIVER
jgi:hypothetical protein